MSSLSGVPEEERSEEKDQSFEIEGEVERAKQTARARVSKGILQGALPDGSGVQEKEVPDHEEVAPEEKVERKNNKNNMISLTFAQEKVLKVIKQASHAYPVTGKQIRSQLNFIDRKEGADMRAVIHALRVKGYPICANGNGYYWPKNDRELSAFITAFQGRVMKEQQAIDGLNKAWDKVEKYKEPSFEERTRSMFNFD